MSEVLHGFFFGLGVIGAMTAVGLVIEGWKATYWWRRSLFKRRPKQAAPEGGE